MRLKQKHFWLALPFVVLALVALWLWWGEAHPPPPQIITLPNGEQYRFAGVTYGTKAVPPIFAARLINWLPASLANRARNYFGARISQTNQGETYAEPRLIVWYARLGTNANLSYIASTGFIPTAHLADEAGVQAGGNAFPIFAGSVTWSFASFPVVPRRSRVLQCYFYPSGYGRESASPFGKLTFRNPLFGRFPQWQPEPIPSTKQTGDLEVRLDEVTSGHSVSGGTIEKPNGSRAQPYEPLQGGESISTGFGLSVRSSKGTNESWALHGAELDDVTGNVLREKSLGFSLIGQRARAQASGWTANSPSLSGALWPDEAAWRLKLELKRVYGFPSEDLVTFKNVPVPVVGATNSVHITNQVGGMQIVLTEFVRKPNITENGFGLWERATQIRVDMPGKPSGVALDFVDISTDAGPAEQYGSSQPDFAFVVAVKSIPTNAQRMDLTFLVQKTRQVEFLVKPPRP